MSSPKVAVVMGSDSDWPIMKEAADVLEAAGELAKQAETLRDGVDLFLTTMRAA